MTVEPNDPRLTALLLGELTDAERAALEAKVAASGSLSESVEGTRQTVEVLRSELAAEPCPHLSPGQRELVLREIAAAGASTGTASTGAWVPLLGSLGWGSWGVWMALAATSLFAVAGLIAWQFRGNRPPDRPAAPVATDMQQPPGDASAVDESVATGRRTTGELSVITIRVGESLQVNVLGQLAGGREITLAPDRLSWSTQPLGDYVEFDPRTMTLTGMKPTAQAVVLTVYLDDLVAKVRVRVIRGD
jgi:hypothetical protein